ncbi:hypothetical protein IXO411_17840, partial [Xanthomonas oryzae pv. oryzae]
VRNGARHARAGPRLLARGEADTRWGEDKARHREEVSSLEPWRWHRADNSMQNFPTRPTPPPPAF